MGLAITLSFLAAVLRFSAHFLTVTSCNNVYYVRRCKVNAISFAGTKDKRGKTTQRMCIKNKRAEQVASTRTYGKAHFGNFSYEHKPLRLGDLSGNKFTLAIRYDRLSYLRIKLSCSTNIVKIFQFVIFCSSSFDLQERHGGR